MKPVLFEKDATEFSSLGICRLPDAIACTVTEERNGAFELELIYPVDGHHAEELREDRIIAVIPRDGATKKQGFRIYRILTEMPGQLTVSARHISYHLTSIPVPVNAGVSDSAQSAMRLLKNWAEEPCPFSFYSDIVGASRSYGISTPTSLRSALGGVQGSILDAYGGELEWDNWDVHLWAARGADNGVRITYGKNLTALSRAVDIGETITGVMGFWQGQNDDGTRALIYTSPRVISNPQAGEYSYPRTMVLDATGAFESPPTVAQLTSYVTSYLTASTLAAVDEAIDVDFVALWQTPEHRDYAPLERVSLCDTVYVGYKQLGVSVKKKVTRVVYNVLAARYDSIQLGSESTVADTIAEIGSEMDTKTAYLTQLFSSKVDKAQYAIDQAKLSYKAGDSISGVLRGWGRVVNAGNALYVTIPLDKPITATDFTLSITSINIATAAGYATYAAATGISSRSIARNLLMCAIPFSQSYPAGTLGLVEINNGTVTFT